VQIVRGKVHLGLNANLFLAFVPFFKAVKDNHFTDHNANIIRFKSFGCRNFFNRQCRGTKSVGLRNLSRCRNLIVYRYEWKGATVITYLPWVMSKKCDKQSMLSFRAILSQHFIYLFPNLVKF
jgi:hypothetical protein